jgi:hypothetical protein
MPISYLGLAGAVLNFSGGVFLVIDSLAAKKTALAHYGARKRSEEEATRDNKPARYQAPDGKELKTLLDWELWLAEDGLKWTWLGFALISTGFLLDILSRIFSPGP